LLLGFRRATAFVSATNRSARFVDEALQQTVCRPKHHSFARFSASGG
jgi:hypothetical protein